MINPLKLFYYYYYWKQLYKETEDYVFNVDSKSEF